MIKTEQYADNLVRTYSDAGYQIERDGAMYDEAIDPVDSGRVYTETDQPVDSVPDDEATAADLEQALRDAGVIA